MSDWLAEARQITDAATLGGIYDAVSVLQDYGDDQYGDEERFIVWARNVMPLMLDALEAADEWSKQVMEVEKLSWMQETNRWRIATKIDAALARVRDTIGEQE